MANNSDHEAAKLHRVFERLSPGNRKRFQGSLSAASAFWSSKTGGHGMVSRRKLPCELEG